MGSGETRSREHDSIRKDEEDVAPWIEAVQARTEHPFRKLKADAKVGATLAIHLWYSKNL